MSDTKKVEKECKRLHLIDVEWIDTRNQTTTNGPPHAELRLRFEGADRYVEQALGAGFNDEEVTVLHRIYAQLKRLLYPSPQEAADQ